MNGLEKIIAHLEADAQTEIDALQAETQRQCGEILAAAQADADAAYAARRKSGEAEMALDGERLASAAEMEEKKIVLAFKQKLVKDAFAAAEAKIAALPEAEYVAFLASLASRAAAYGEEELIFNDRDAAAVGKKVVCEANKLLKERGLHGGLTLSEETRNISGGVILRHGNIESNCSIAALIESQRSELATPVAEILFRE